MSKAACTVLAIDPGRSKCGIAVVQKTFDKDQPDNVIHQSVISTDILCKTVVDLADQFAPDIIIIGDGTMSAELTQAVISLQIAPTEIVDEKYSSLIARKKFFEKNPPRGIRKFIPVSLQTPNRPYDDFVAILLAERYLSAQ